MFENRTELDPHRARLWSLIRATPALDWLLLTKRPQLIAKRLPSDWGDGYANVWLGATAESQVEANRRLPHLLSVRAAVHFVSAEPLLSGVDLSPWLSRDAPRRVTWVIAGGESGPKARPSDPSWFRGLRDQCLSSEVSFHFKQWGGKNKKKTGRILDGRTWDEWPNSKRRGPRPSGAVVARAVH